MFAEAKMTDYSLPMATSSRPRRFACLPIALLFGISMVAHGFAVSQATAKTMMADTSIDMGTPGHPMDCGGKGIGAKTACFAMCASAVAILCDPARVLIVSAMHELTVEPQVPALDRGIPPEPPPPKSVTLI